ncbi:glycosyltransferase family 61 protein [Alteromonas sp. C1M14]|uniref:glycosyltransferase family 61 protein n=1 Tax=Alteromonas sp. C1M14 TaxID=2841567 RepID=UPI001C0A0F93|nr:glycosyltransferase family 61 protein [Alteromonas sp. C1M14]MBU2978112.1 glycosyltransferase family 61 protein [Alteromonas sp. C1M14]
MSKRIIFHIGPPKTGSSAIQHFLHHHRTELASFGILYPNHTVDENGISSGNARVVCSADERGRLILDSKKLIRALDAFENEKNYHTLLLSSESFFRILDDVIEQVPGVEIVCFIRNPVEFQLSIYNQSVKRHGNHKPFTPRTKLNLGQWEKLLVANNQLLPDLFHCFAYKSPDDQGSIIGDLLKVLHIEEDVSVSTTSVNVSYSFAALELKRCLNQFPIASLQRELDTYLQATSQHSPRYRLIDDEALTQCQQQLEAAMCRFRSLLTPAEWKLIAEAQAQLTLLPFVDQAHSEDKVAELVMQLHQERPSLYRALANVLAQNKNPKTNNFIPSLFKVSLLARLAGGLVLWRRNLVGSLKERITQGEHISKETSCGFGAIRCANVDILIQEKGANPAIVKGGLRGEALPDFAQQYRHHPIYKSDDRPISATDMSSLSKSQASLKTRRGVYYYGGPVFNNFGHFLAECVHRLAALSEARRLDTISKVVFLPQRYSRKRGLPTPVLPPHFYAILAYFGIAKKDVLLPTKSFVAANLWIAPQQSVFRSRTGISEPYRQFLVSREKAAGIKADPSKPKKIYISRTGFLLRGAFAGESVLEAMFAKQGFFIMKPENLSLQEQLIYYKSAEVLIFAEGTALHVLELLGEIPGKIVVLQRRKHADKMFTPLLAKRCDEVVCFSEVHDLQSLYFAPSAKRPAYGSALSVLDSHALAAFLETHAQCRALDTDLFKQQASKDISLYYQTYKTKRLSSHLHLLSRFTDQVSKLLAAGILSTPPKF